MPENLGPRASYDRIAHLYDVDMARNMAFDDVAFYSKLARHSRGRVLELGCGNGRILLELLAAGIDAVGVDCSSRMLAELQQKATARGLGPRLCQMDARALAFGEAFALVLCPYSLITYMSGPDDASRMLASVRGVLAPGASIVVDAFIPKPMSSAADFSIDYRRNHRDATLTRSKRVAAVAPSVNRIERRYELLGAGGQVLESIDTSEDVRTFAPEEIVSLLRASGFVVGQQWWDYVERSVPGEAQYFTVSACSVS